jgi:hypothetical protein
MVTMGLPSGFRPVWKILEEAGDCAWSKLQKLHPRMRKKIKRARMVEVSLPDWQTTGMTQKGHVLRMWFTLAQVSLLVIHTDAAQSGMGGLKAV